MLDNVKKVARDLIKRTRSAQAELRDGLEAVRRDVRRLKEERQSVERKPCTLELAQRRAEELIAGEVAFARGATRFANVDGLSAAPAHYPKESPDRQQVMAMLIAFAAPCMLQTMKAELAERYAGLDAITEEDRASQLDRLDRELLDLELTEESIIRNAEASGFPIVRRGDADPRAVLAADEALP